MLIPHLLESARLLACATAEVQADRLAAARQLAERFQCVVALKGSGGVIAAPGRVPCINAIDNASLASAATGTGDVLAGWLAGPWAQWPAVDGRPKWMLASSRLTLQWNPPAAAEEEDL